MATISKHKTDDSIIEVNKENMPAIFAGPAEGVSKRYVHVPTSEFIPIAQQAGWDVFNAGMKKRQARTMIKNPNANQTARHFVAFRPSDEYLHSRNLESNLVFDNGVARVSKAIPRLLVYNSHDCTSGLEAVMGLYEFICSNSSITCSDEWGKYKFRHMNINVKKIMGDFFTSVLDSAFHVLDLRNEMQRIEVTKNQALEYAERVIDCRWDGEKFSVNPEDLIHARYEEQSDLTAYNVFNNVQRNMTQGGIYATNKNPQGKQNPRRKQTAIRDFRKDFQINQELWTEVNGWLNDMGKQLPPPPKVNINVK